MRILLDAHALIWAVDNPSLLGSDARAALQDSANDLLLGAGTIWELSIKVNLGKLTLSSPFQSWMIGAISSLGIIVLPISIEHCAAQAALPPHHRDPFDRLLAAQAQVEGMSVASTDVVFDHYGITRIW